MVPPTEAMARGRRDFEVRVDRKRDAWIGLLLAGLGTLAAFGPPIGGKPLLGYLSALLFVASAALLAPLVVYRATLGGSMLSLIHILLNQRWSRSGRRMPRWRLSTSTSEI